MSAVLPENLIFFCDDHWNHLLPLTYTRPICELRVGILTIREKWEQWLGISRSSYITQDYLSEKFPLEIASDNLLINSTVLPDSHLLGYVKQIQTNESLVYGDELIAARLSAAQLNASDLGQSFDQLKKIDLSRDENLRLKRITRVFHLFSYNGEEIHSDFALITFGRKSATLSESNRIFGKYPVFAEEGVQAECAIINTNDGPVYLGRNAEIMEGSMIRGPFALGENSMIKMGAKIYGDTTVGPGCKVGGEVNNAVFIGNANKGHDGFLGNSVIGEWCNLGADSNNSNLKNNYLPVKLWSYVKEGFENTGLQFADLSWATTSKCGINTMFNTGTVVGVAANTYGDGFPRNFIPSFSWGGASGFITHQLEKAIETAEIVMKRRGKTLDEADKKILNWIFSHAARYRTWEKH
ncbi:MAG: GlmU family protein [Saprospiraceae bacterium]|nr:GlmU family protein [Saprospiraceae bacterium]